MEGDYLELSQFPYNSHPFPYNSHHSPLGTTGFLTSGIRAIDLETGEYDLQEILKMVNEVLEKVKALTESHEAISNKFKALAESNKAMNEELSRLQEDLENMSEEELQLLEGTTEKFLVLDSEDANGSEDVADLEEFLDLKEFVSFNGPCKRPIAVQVQVHSTPQTLVETIIACPVQDQRILGRQPSLVVQSLGVEH